VAFAKPEVHELLEAGKSVDGAAAGSQVLPASAREDGLARGRVAGLVVDR